MRAIFDLLDATGRRATFFMLGITARNYPDVALEIVRRGDELASHGFGHERVHRLAPEAFRRDVEASIELLDKLTGRRPRGYRAPVFSIRRDTVWALETLADLGFEYDSSLHDSPRIAGRITGIPGEPCVVRLPSGREIVECPLAVWQRGRISIPVGGGSYWRFLPAALLTRALGEVGRTNPFPACYLHPYECDPEYLQAELPLAPSWSQRRRAACYTLRYRFGQKRVLPRLKAVLRRFPSTAYEEAIPAIRKRSGAHPRALSEGGVFVPRLP
jgi:polysaccharide deacetylase family protein (PEP-CTERM system associated)